MRYFYRYKLSRHDDLPRAHIVDENRYQGVDGQIIIAVCGKWPAYIRENGTVVLFEPDGVHPKLPICEQCQGKS